MSPFVAWLYRNVGVPFLFAWYRAKETIRCAFGGHGPVMRERRTTRWPSWCDVEISCASCGKVVKRWSVDSEIRR